MIALKRITQGIEIASRDLSSSRIQLNGSDTDAAKMAGPMSDLATRIEGFAGDIAKFMNGETLPGTPTKKAAKPAADTAAPPPLDAAAETMAAEAERLAAMSATVALTGGGRTRSVAAAAPAAEPGARERRET